MKTEHYPCCRRFRVALCFAFPLILGACDKPDTNEDWRSTQPLTDATEPSDQVTLTLGDIDPDTPMHKVIRIQPLANHLARELGWEGSDRVRVRIARSIEEMATMIANGRVDILLDSVYPTLAVHELSDSQLMLEVVVEKQRTYHAILIARVGSDINNLENLVDRTISVQDRFSTSGYLLPAAFLINQGYTLDHVSGPDQLPSSGQIGYFFSGDEENTVAMIRNGVVAAGALSSQDYDELPAEAKSEVLILGRSNNVPRKLASVRPDMDSELVEQVKAIFLSINDQDRARMSQESNGRGWRWEFERITEETETGIAQVQAMIGQLEDTEDSD